MKMTCPRHGVNLESDTIEGHAAGRCPDCGGLWIAGDAVDGLLGTAKRMKLRSLCSARESILACPKDGKRLGEGLVARVKVDLCHACHGLWLDPGELEQLRQEPRVRPTVYAGRKSDASPARPACDLALGAGEVALSLLLGAGLD